MSHLWMAEFSICRLYTVPSGDAPHRIDAILVGCRTSNVKTTCRKSCPANVLQVSNLIFDPLLQGSVG